MNAIDKFPESFKTELCFYASSSPSEESINLIFKSIKRSLFRDIANIIGNNVIAFSELQTVWFEDATIINARPIRIGECWIGIG